MNIGCHSKEPATRSIGGVHIISSVNAAAPRARRHPLQTPHAARTNRTGNATLPVALLKNAAGSHHGGATSQSNFPAEAASRPAVSETYKAGARMISPASIVAPAMNTERTRSRQSIRALTRITDSQIPSTTNISKVTGLIATRAEVSS